MVPSQITAKLKHALIMVPPQNYSQTETFPLRICSRLLVLIIGEKLGALQRKLFRLVESLFWAINFNSSQSKVRLELWYCLCILKKFLCSTDWFEEGMCIYN